MGSKRKKAALKARPAGRSSKWLMPALAAGVALYFLYLKSSDAIINYPAEIKYSVFGGCLVLAVLYQASRKTPRVGCRHWDLFGVLAWLFDEALPVVIASWLLTGILLIPFNYYNLHVGSTNSSFTEVVRMEGLASTRRRKADTLYFRYKGRMNVIYGETPELTAIARAQTVKNYRLVLTLSQGVAGSYILSNWEVVPAR